MNQPQSLMTVNLLPPKDEILKLVQEGLSSSQKHYNTINHDYQVKTPDRSNNTIRSKSSIISKSKKKIVNVNIGLSNPNDTLDQNTNDEHQRSMLQLNQDLVAFDDALKNQDVAKSSPRSKCSTSRNEVRALKVD